VGQFELPAGQGEQALRRLHDERVEGGAGEPPRKVVVAQQPRQHNRDLGGAFGPGAALLQPCSLVPAFGEPPPFGVRGRQRRGYGRGRDVSEWDARADLHASVGQGAGELGGGVVPGAFQVGQVIA